MNRKMIVIAILMALTVFNPMGRASRVAAADFEFLGTWVNVDSETRGLTRLQIFQVGSQLKVRGFGKCSPTDCDWGLTDLNTAGMSISDTDTTHAVARYDFGFKDTVIAIHFEGNQMAVETYNVFKDGSGRKNYRTMSLLKKI